MVLAIKPKSKLKENGILFCGKNSDTVTGSCIYLKYEGIQILLECGLYQSSKNSYLDSYKVNTEKFPFKPSEINYVFVNHAHIDHSGLLPRLIKEGFTGKIILTKATASISELLMKNCSYILADEARILSKRYDREYYPIYTLDDVERTLDFFTVYDQYDTIYQLDEVVSFQWIRNSHCVGAAQLQLILNGKSGQKKILYTSDIGSLSPKNYYVGTTEIPNFFNDITILESTYGNPKRINKKTRNFDVEHLRVAIKTVLERNGTIVLPAFSFSRSQELLSVLYELFGNDNTFNTPVVVDSMLTCDVTDVYNEILDKQSIKEWNKVYNWKNVKYIREKIESQSCVLDESPKIVISSSGFCTNGRVLSYLDKYLRDKNSMIIFSGYVGDNDSYLSYRIKNYKDHKNICINKKPVPNRADAMCLSTFSSHADFNDLVTYGSNLRTNKLVLVHGDTDAKINLKKALNEAISKNDNTYKVICSERGMIINI